MCIMKSGHFINQDTLNGVQSRQCMNALLGDGSYSTQSHD